MRLTPPKMITFWIAVALGLLGFLGHLTPLSIFTTYDFWFVFVGFALLVIALLTKGL